MSTFSFLQRAEDWKRLFGLPVFFLPTSSIATWWKSSLPSLAWAWEALIDRMCSSWASKYQDIGCGEAWRVSGRSTLAPAGTDSIQKLGAWQIILLVSESWEGLTSLKWQNQRQFFFPPAGISRLTHGRSRNRTSVGGSYRISSLQKTPRFISVHIPPSSACSEKTAELFYNNWLWATDVFFFSVS